MKHQEVSIYYEHDCGTEILSILILSELLYKQMCSISFVIFAGKQLCQSLFLSCNIIKRDPGTGAFQRILQDF